MSNIIQHQSNRKSNLRWLIVKYFGLLLETDDNLL